MKNVNYGNRKTIYCICGIMVLWTLGAHAAALPPDPDNAALLYYQAFQHRPEPYDEVEKLVYNTRIEKLYDILRGGKLDPDPEVEIPKIEKSIHELEKDIKNLSSGSNEKMSPRERARYRSERYIERLFSQLESLKKSRKNYEKMRGVNLNKKIRYYLWKCRKAIAVAQVASEIPECNWGTMCSHEFGYISPDPMDIKNFARLLLADAMRLAADGDYRLALKRCLMVRRFARHVGGESKILCMVSLAFDAQALKSIQIILCSMPPDEEILRWLQSQLVSVRGASQLFSVSLERDFKITMQLISIRANPNLLTNIREQFAESAKDKTDEELITMAREPYAKFLDSILRALGKEKPYEQTYARIESLSKVFVERNQNNPVIVWVLESDAEAIPGCYNIHVAHKAHLNALKAAVEIYLIKAETGQLPKTLPSGLPKDSYSGEDFGYEITDYGFALRSQGKRFKEGRPRQMLEFKVKK